MDAIRLRFTFVRLLPGVSRPLTAALVFAIVVSAALPVVFTIATGVLVGTVPDVVGRGLSSDPGRRILVALAVAGAAFVLIQVTSPVLAALSETLGRRLDGQLRARAMAATLAPLGMQHLEDPDVLDRANLARGAMDGNFTPGGAVAGVATNAAQVLQSMSSAIIVARFNLWLALALVVGWRIVRVILLRQFFAQVVSMIGMSQAMRRSTYFRDLALTPAAAKEGRIFGLAGWMEERFTQHWVEGMTEVWKTRRKGRAAVGAVIVGISTASFVGFLLVGRAAIAGDLSLTALTILLSAVVGIGTLSISDADLHVGYGLAALPALLELEAMVDVTADDLPGAGGAADGLPREWVRFESVGFAYPGQRRPVLHHLDLAIPAGRSTAIVGENGAGKTTLVKLLCRLYEPTAGRITIDGQPLDSIDWGAWQRRVAAIFQDFIRYEMTAAENVACGAPAERIDEAAVVRAVERAGAAEIVAELADGLATPLSRQLAGGTDLSGGQWQRIALARALYAVEAGAGVLILDEPTASLDVRAEAELYDRFLELTRGLTTIVISHRFSTVRRADNIVVVEKGQVVEQGTHDDLVASDGRYAAMFRLQAARFTPEDAS